MTADGETAARDDAVRAGEAAPFILTTEEILSQVETAVIVVDHDGALRYANRFAADLFGFPDAAHLTNVPFRRLGFHEEDIGKVENLEYQACRGRDWEGTLAIRRPDQSNFFVRMNAAALRGPAGEVADTVVPQFADHCFIDLRTKEGLVRRVLKNAWDWTPTRGRWAAIGELVTYPPNHFCIRAMAQSETILIEDLHDEDQPAPTAASLEASKEAGMT